MIFFLEKLRRLFKSLGKYEFKVLDKITLLESNVTNLAFNDDKFLDLEKNIKNKAYKPKKIAVVICFHHNKKRINNLNRICKIIKDYKFSKNISIITNDISNKESNLLKKKINIKQKKINIIQIKNIPEPHLLPWYCFDLLKKKYKDKSYSHFLYLEDDILINSANISYWIYCRKILKSFNLIPAFLRCEINNGNLFSVDNPKIIKIKDTPKLLSKSKKYGFLNLKYPYHASSLMDRDLMREYTKSKLISIDYGIRHKFMKVLYPIKELSNIMIGYINVPKGYHNRFFIPFINSNKIPLCCITKHLDNKYSKIKNSYFGKIKVDNLIKN
jgi:hypothetical protein